jgi:hypothetical protein
MLRSAGGASATSWARPPRHPTTSLTAASAFAAAEPEYYTAKNTCSKKYGHLAYAGECIINGKPVKAQLISYTEKGGPANLEGALKIECASNEGKGKLSGGTANQKANLTTKLKITYKGCHETGKTTECTKSFSTPGTIITENIKGTLVRASETEGGGTIVANELEGEKEAKGFATFKCGTSTNFLTVKVKGKIIIEVSPLIAKPDGGTALSNAGETFNREKAAIAGCGKQKLLYVNALKPCHFLQVEENGKALEPSWNVAENEVLYGTKKVETVEKGEF